MSVTVGVNERLAALTAAGTSVWLDQIRRGMIESGELQRLIDEYSLRGVTSNPAIFEQAIFEGINVNVTLLFAVSAYEDVAEAYIRGLERRREAGESVDVRSVASFFVSRVDSEVDKRLEAIGGHDELLGGAGLWNARK